MKYARFSLFLQIQGKKGINAIFFKKISFIRRKKKITLNTKHIIYSLTVLCLLLFAGGCKMKKNTAFRRNYQALNTTYNVYFNANEAFKRGIKNIEDSYKPDYSHIISMYAVSDKSTAGVATGDMARAIEKSEKAIKERSIKQKPKKNLNKTRDPKYMAFYNQEEFNPKMSDVWMMLGKAKFYSNDYLAASATFTYIINHFPENKLLVAEASIWKARSFKEMGWTYEAHDILKKVSDDKFTDRLSSLYAGAWADLLIREGNLKEALPYLETAISLEKNKKARTRFTFIAGQIYQQLGDKETAYERYAKVISSHPDYQMAFNARIRQTEVYTGSSSKDMIKSLTQMTKNSKNKDFLDQIYYAIGNIHLARKDTAKAIENYILSTQKSTRDGQEKAQSFIALGDLYYIQAKYLKAQPAYSEASSIIGIEHPEYQRVSNLSQILDELAANYQTVLLQDSLQLLAALPKEQRMAAINSVIQQIRKEEAEEQKRREREREENRQLDLEIENMALMDQRALGSQKVSFYFDNKAVVEKGKIEFQRRFGRRKLEDNWNRKNRAIMNIPDESLADDKDEALENMDPAAADSVRESRKQAEGENNPKNPDFYLRQIPFTAEQIAASNEQIADALFNMGIIYNEKLFDYARSIEVFDEFARRFPNDPRVADAYFYSYRILAKLNKEDEAGVYRDKLITQFPESKYAKILSQPDYREKLERMHAEQDSLYEATYKAYLAGDFETVKANTAYMEATFPVSPLIPKFLLLNALSIGKSGDIETFSASLNNLIERYPNSDVVSMAKDILALMNQGKSPEAGTPGGLMALRQSNEEASKENVKGLEFKINEHVPHLFILFTDPEKVNENRLLYEIASYNFTKFLVKDFDIKVQKGQLTVSGLDNLEEALWYINGVFDDKGIQQLLAGTEYRYLIITVENYELLLKGLTIEEYDTFFKNFMASRKKKSTGRKVQLIGEEKALDEIATSQSDLSEIKEGDNLTNAKQTVKSQSAVPENETLENVNVSTKTDTPQEEKQTAIPAQTETANAALKAPKELQKYKGLYTYDEDAPHYFVIIMPKGGADFDAVKAAIEAYNSTSQMLLNLSITQESGKNLPQMIVTGTIPDAALAQRYIQQVVKDEGIKNALKGVDYRNIVISQDNLKTLKESGNLTVYMELFRHFYLK